VANATAIVNIGELVTMAGPPRPRVGEELRELGIERDAALLVEDGRIVAAGGMSNIRSKIPKDAVVIDADGRCVTPGFVDAHTHLVFAGNRAAEFEQRIGGATYQQIAAAGGGILRTVALTRAASEEEHQQHRRDGQRRGAVHDGVLAEQDGLAVGAADDESALGDGREDGVAGRALEHTIDARIGLT